MAFHRSLLGILCTMSCVLAQAPTVTLDTGVWKGVPTQQAGSSVPVHKFLGLPFAAPPLRLGVPQPPAKSTAQKNADTLPPACIQNGGSLLSSAEAPESEDCLYLNLFTPAARNASSVGKAVMVWFFGGALQFGSGSLPGYDGTSFATNHDIILIAPNYRTNFFGFPGEVPGIAIQERNLGFLDQRLALDWVQQNVHKFGGDPRKVTIFGQSAGGRSVDFHLLTNNPKNPPFRAVIVQSGSAHITPGVVGNPMNVSAPKTRPFLTLAAKLGCSVPEEALTCIRKVPFQQIKRAVATMGQFGLVDDNGFTTVRDSERARREHRVGNVSLLIGTTADEQKATMAGQMRNNFKQYLDNTYGNNTALKAKISQSYPISANSPYKNDYDAAVAAATDVGFTCVTSRESRISAEAGYRKCFPFHTCLNYDTYTSHPATWRFLFNASYPNTEQFPGSGAFHSAEIQFVFGNLKTPKGPSSAEEKSLSVAMQSAWANFAKDPFTGPGWDRVGAPGGKDLGHFNYNGKLILDTPAFLDRNCHIFEDLIAAKSS
jgi:carboxylesterase type B